MWSIFKLKIRRKILLVIMAFTIIASAVLVFISIKSLKLDEDHLTSIEYLNNIDVEISHSRIFLDDYYLFDDSLRVNDVLKSIKESEGNIAVLDSFILETYHGEKEILLREALRVVKNKARQLNKIILSGLSHEKEAFDIHILENYNAFSDSYQELDKYIRDHILSENIRFKRIIYIIILSILLLLVTSLLLIQNFISAYNAAEKEQATRSIEIEYKERKRIAADLHDGLGSILSSIALFIKLAEKGNEDNTVNTSLAKVKELSIIALENLEAVINNLSPSNLDRHGLIYSLEIICEQINEMGKLRGKVIAPDKDIKCTPNLRVNLYRICNELINNTLKHSEATYFEIEFQKQKKELNVIYKDNGIGFNTNLIYLADDEKMGLKNIANRVETMGGEFMVTSDLNNGVEYKFWFKL